jgi:hypothetical protein
MTKGREALLDREVAEQKRFFITLGGPTAGVGFAHRFRPRYAETNLGTLGQEVPGGVRDRGKSDKKGRC